MCCEHYKQILYTSCIYTVSRLFIKLVCIVLMWMFTIVPLSLPMWLHIQVNSDDLYNYNYANEPRPTAAEDSTLIDRTLLHHPTSELCQQPGECSDCLAEQRADDGSHASTAAMLDSASLSSYHAVEPQVSHDTVTPPSTVKLWQQCWQPKIASDKQTSRIVLHVSVDCSRPRCLLIACCRCSTK